MAVLDWLQQLLGGGDPEAQGAAAASTAMMPAVNQWAQNVGSGQYVRQGLPSTYDPNQSFAQNALNPNSLENALNVALGVGGGSGLGIKAYHASPYDFSVFDASKIGTGQGAQSYGHGIYAAESPAVSGPKGTYDLEFTAKNLGKPDLNQGEASVLRMLRDNASDMDIVGNLGRNGYSFDDALSTLNRVKAARAKIYEVNINAEPNQLLDWDKQLIDQPAVRQKLADAGIINPRSEFLQTLAKASTDTGGQVYESSRLVPGAFRDPQAASAALNQMGIPGIRYLDQGSRGAGQGTSNYVVFDPKIIDILRKYGLVPPVAGAGLLGAADQQ